MEKKRIKAVLKGGPLDGKKVLVSRTSDFYESKKTKTLYIKRLREEESGEVFRFVGYVS